MTHAILLLLLAALPAAAALRAGAAAADITPTEWPVRVIGNFGLTLAKSAHDALQARAAASKQTGIPVSRILISATHTHSAPPSRAEAGNALEERYVKRLIGQTARAIAEANQRLASARIAGQVIPVPDELFNRRWFMRAGAIPPSPFGETTDRARMNPPAGSQDLVHPAGGTDPGFSVVSLQTADGKPLALLGNYSLHYVGGVPGPEVSADYFGEFARLVARELAPGDPAFVAMLTNGTSGDVNNIDFVHPRPRAEPYERIGVVAGKLARHAMEAARGAAYRTDAPVRMAESILRLAYRRPTPEQLRFAQAALTEPDEAKLPRNAKAYAERALKLESGPAFADVKLQALRIGELGIAAIPCEVFTEIGITIKELSPFRPTFTIELANGHYGYLPTPRHFELGGYETWLGTNNLEREASVKITRTILDLLNQVKR